MADEWYEDDFDDDLTVAFRPSPSSGKPTTEPFSPTVSSNGDVDAGMAMPQSQGPLVDDFDNDETIAARLRPRPNSSSATLDVPEPVQAPSPQHRPPVGPAPSAPPAATAPVHEAGTQTSGLGAPPAVPVPAANQMGHPQPANANLKAQAPNSGYEWKPPSRVTASHNSQELTRNKWILPAVVIGLVLVIGVVVAILVGGGSDEDETEESYAPLVLESMERS